MNVYYRQTLKKLQHMHDIHKDIKNDIQDFALVLKKKCIKFFHLMGKT